MKMIDKYRIALAALLMSAHEGSVHAQRALELVGIDWKKKSPEDIKPTGREVAEKLADHFHETGQFAN